MYDENNVISRYGFVSQRKQNRSTLSSYYYYYIRQMNAVNGADNAFIRCVSVCPCSHDHNFQPIWMKSRTDV